MGVTDKVLIAYYFILRFASVGCLLGAVVRFSRRAKDGEYHIHTPATGALCVLIPALAMLVIGAAFVKFGLKWTIEKYKEKTKRMMGSASHKAFNVMAPVVWGVGLILGGWSSADLGWAVADACSLLGAWLAVVGTWWFVKCLDRCFVSQPPAGAREVRDPSAAPAPLPLSGVVAGPAPQMGMRGTSSRAHNISAAGTGAVPARLGTVTQPQQGRPPNPLAVHGVETAA